MSGASAASATLQEAARKAYQNTLSAGGRLAKAQAEQRKATDVVEVMRATVEVIVATADLHDAAEHAEKSLRAALSSVMDEIGCSSVQASHHGAHLARRPAFLSVSDEALIPREYFVQPPPSLDKRAALAAIKNGVEVPGCSKAIPNEPVLVIRARETVS